MTDTITIPKTEYNRLHRIAERYTALQKFFTSESEEWLVDAIIAEGEEEFRAGKTVIASSSEEAMKKHYAAGAAHS